MYAVYKERLLFLRLVLDGSKEHNLIITNQVCPAHLIKGCSGKAVFRPTMKTVGFQSAITVMVVSFFRIDDFPVQIYFSKDLLQIILLKVTIKDKKIIKGTPSESCISR